MDAGGSAGAGGATLAGMSLRLDHVVLWVEDPLASGRLTRDWSSEQTLRSETDQIAKGKYDATAETDRQVVERVAELAEKQGVPRVHIALAWLLQKQPVVAPIIGATKITHLEDAVGALSVKLTQEEVASLEAPYVPHPIVGHQ